VLAQAALKFLEGMFFPNARECGLGKGCGDARRDGCLAFITVNGEPVCVAAVAGPACINFS
jgi:hypothetical protein